MRDRPSLLLVDDDATLCSVLARALEGRGYGVTTAHSGACALQLIDAMLPEYAIVDLRLPDMSGLKVVRRLIDADPNTRVVVLTGYGSIASAIDAIKLGAVSYLTKPANADQIEGAFAPQEPDIDAAGPVTPMTVSRLEWEHIQRVLTTTDNNISAAARTLHMHRRTLQRKLAKRPPRT
jgi:two-component system, response regulator RegA